MTNQSKLEIVRHYHKDYQRASKTVKNHIISSIQEITSYSRKHIISLLNNPIASKRTKQSKNRGSLYTQVIEKLEYIWAVSNMICGKRLKAILPTILSSLKTHKEISITENEEALLLKMSASTMDRLLTNAKKDPLVKGKSSTKPGTLLKHQIPIRTFADWNEKMPGFIEIDLVAHCGVSLRGEYVKHFIYD